MQPGVEPAQVTRRIHGDAHAHMFHPVPKDTMNLPHRRREKGASGAAWLLAKLCDRLAASDNFVRIYRVNHESNRIGVVTLATRFTLSDHCLVTSIPVLAIVPSTVNSSLNAAKIQALSATILRSYGKCT